MTDLRTAAQQALEALEDMLGWQSLAPQTIQESAKGRAAALRAALAEPVQDGFDQLIAETEADSKGAQALEEGRRWVNEQFYAGAEPVREPAGWLEGPFGEFRANQLFKHSWPAQTVAWSIPLYLAPPPRKPLSEEEILSLFRTSGSPVEFARAIEAQHGIGDKDVHR